MAPKDSMKRGTAAVHSKPARSGAMSHTAAVRGEADIPTQAVALTGGPYGGGPWGGRQAGTPRGGYGDESDQSPAMREYIYPASEVTFILKDNEADLTDDTARKRVFFTDGRKLQKPKDENYREIAAHWEGNRLVADEKLQAASACGACSNSARTGAQLNEEVDLDATRARGAVTLHYVYNINTNRQ